MIDLGKLQEMNFFLKRDEILQGNETFGVEDILLPRPMLSASAGALQFMLKTNSKFNLENRAAFLEKLEEIFGEEALISIFEETHLKSAIENGVGITCIYEDFLQSAIPIRALREDESLESQWAKEEQGRAISISDTRMATITPLAAMIRAANLKRKIPHDQTNGKRPKDDGLKL